MDWIQLFALNPTYATPEAAGMQLRVCLMQPMTMMASLRALYDIAWAMHACRSDAA